MTDDLLKRLLKPVDDPFFGKVVEPIKWEAFYRIEQLEAALREIETLELDPRNSRQTWVEALRQIARKALEGNDD
jgi:hypothetical protein